MKFLLYIISLSVSAAHAADLIGSTIPPYPPDLIHKQGACVAPAVPGVSKSCDYSIGILEDPKGKPKILFGARKTGPNESNKPFWIIKDTMPYPALPEGYYLAIATCQEKGKDNLTIIAAVRAANTEFFKDILWVRRFDLQKEKFVEHTNSDVQCINEGWGL